MYEIRECGDGDSKFYTNISQLLVGTFTPYKAVLAAVTRLMKFINSEILAAGQIIAIHVPCLPNNH